ncbi:uncharacterized protein [Rutidosis leptorrhynchoides]|uniref:uncharacterized protein n=1 Tax=Rutidosis leptorrhynchoides TaxID=125765 RepID=UPI003A98FCC2
MPALIKTPEPEKCEKKPKFNLRKSLAWDSAFFTSDGVLDADELSTMIEGGGDKGVKHHHLPGIEEEVYRSMDSLSSLASDNLSLECLEAELFDDIRASIQKSNRASNLNNSNIKVSSGKKDIQPKISNPSKKVDPDNGKRFAVRNKDNTSGIPQPKITSRVNSTSTSSKRVTLSAIHAKKEQDIAKQANVSLKGPQALKTTPGSKATGAIGPRRGVPKPMLSSKSSMLASSSNAPKMDPTRPSSSCSNSSSCSSGTDVKTSTSLSRRKVDSKGVKVTAGSIVKAPSRIISKKKQAPVDSRLSSRLVVTNLPSSISPASSVSEWDSDSSSSNQRCSIDTGASFRSSVESASSIHPTDRSNQNGNQTAALNASQTGPLSRPPSVQPTGLRMPSPKIGFFDGGKSGVRTPTGGVRTGPTSSNVSKVGKIPLPKTAAPTNMKPNIQKTTLKLDQEQQSSKPKTASASQGVKSFLVPPKQANLGNKSVSKIDTADCSRAPFAVKNSVSAANGTDVSLTEKTVNLSYVETQHKENSELI